MCVCAYVSVLSLIVFIKFIELWIIFESRTTLQMILFMEIDFGWFYEDSQIQIVLVNSPAVRVCIFELQQSTTSACCNTHTH